MTADAPDPFAVPGSVWSRVSPRLATLRRVEMLCAAMLLVVLLVVLAVMAPSTRPVVAVAVGALLVVSAYGWWLTGRQVAAWGWVERDSDLVVTRGRVWRRLDVVPYGRMQLVDVTAGPLQRAFGVTTVMLHTASPSTRARVPGLPPEDARRLRDRLAERGEAQAAGL